jgi:predicted branched-subunit amino acid permease
MGFVLTALFIVLTMDAYRENPDRIVLGLALGAALVAQVVLPGSMVLLAMSLFAIALIARSKSARPGDVLGDFRA